MLGREASNSCEGFLRFCLTFRLQDGLGQKCMVQYLGWCSKSKTRALVMWLDENKPKEGGKR
jgi:hypothetical protein